MLRKRKGISEKEGAKSSGLRWHQRLSGRGHRYNNQNCTYITGQKIARFSFQLFVRAAQVLWFARYSFGLHKFCGLRDIRFGLHKFCGLRDIRFGLHKFCGLHDIRFGLHKFCGLRDIRFGLHKCCGLRDIRFGLYNVLWFARYSFWAARALWFASGLHKCCVLRILRAFSMFSVQVLI